MTGSRLPIDPAVQATTGTRFVWNDLLGCWATAEGDEPGYVSHFFTCVNAAQHRKSDQMSLVPDE